MNKSTIHELRDRIAGALKKLGPSSPRIVVDEIGNVDPGVVSYHLRQMVKAKTLKASGTTASRIYALADGKPADTPSAPPQRRKKSKGNGKRATPKPHAPRARPTAPLFLPAFTEDSRLVIVRDNGHALFTPEQTQSIADLLLNHFEV